MVEMLRGRTWGRRIAAALLSMSLGCAPTVVTLEEDDSTDPEPDPTPCSIDPGAVVELHAVTSGALLDGVLHVEAELDGLATVALIDLAPAPPILLGTRPDLGGGGPWVPSGPSRWARVRGGEIEALDTTEATTPVLATQRPLGGELRDGFAGIYTSASDALFACLSSDVDGQSFLSKLSLIDPGAPPERLINQPCESFGARASAESSLWIDWDPDGVVVLYDLARARGIDSHSFSTDGVHHYGFITSVATDGALTATTVENDHYAFFYYADVQPRIVYTSLGDGEKKLLEVADAQAIVAVPSAGGASIRSFAMLPRPAPETPAAPTAMSVDLLDSSADLARLRVLGHDDDRLIVTDGDHLWEVPIGGQEAVPPMVVVREGTPRCDD